MTKQASWVALSWLCVWIVSGCGEVEKCKRGEPNCPPDSNNGAAIKDKDTFCTQYENPVTEVAIPIPCYGGDARDEMLSFEDACKAACLQRCYRAAVYCPGYVCDPSSCEGALALCRVDCPGGAAQCATQLCERARDGDCASFMCPVGYQRDCSDVLCRNNCTTRGVDNVRDGFCDDGDPRSAAYALCAYGNDCSDCGPRRGAPLSVAPIGGSCVFDTGCGFVFDFRTTPAWCVNVPGAPGGQASCVPNCTDKEEMVCPDGYECTGLRNSIGEPHVSGGIQAFACVPTVCE